MFSVRLEVRVDAEETDPSAMAELLAVEEAETFLKVLGLGHGKLTTRISSMSAAAERG